MPAPGPLPVEQGGQVASAASLPASRSAAGVPIFWGAPAGLAGQVHDAREPLRDQIVAGAIGARIGQPEAGQRDVDQVRPRGLQRRVVGAELGLQARQLVQDHDVRAPDQLERAARGPRAGVVERQAQLVAVDREEPERLAIQERRAPVAGIVARCPAARP